LAVVLELVGFSGEVLVEDEAGGGEGVEV